MGEKRTLHTKNSTAGDELHDLRCALSYTRQEMQAAYNRFNFASDPDLVESYVYEINALQCRYNYLLRQVKACSRTATSERTELLK